MAKAVLITGGAGFIGSHLADRLIAQGYRVRALDSLDPQVHGPGAERPAYLHPDVELMVDDVRDARAVRRALDGIDAVFHFAARVGVGQSMYQIADYVDVNVTGTGVLLEALIERPVERLVVASSMSIYGEGLYRDARGRVVEGLRDPERLKQDDWEARGPDGEVLTPIPTAEDKKPSIASIYAMSKMDQETMCLLTGQAYNIPTTALRFFNVYGEHQALSNPYTGVLAIFGSRLLNDNPPLVFEDGLQRRDFVHVSDVARACQLALEREAAVGRAFNVGSGRDVNIREVAEHLARVMGKSIEPAITGKYRIGDIRNCFADIAAAQSALGFRPEVAFDDGLATLAEWLREQQAEDRVAQASAELSARGLTV